MAMIIDGLFWAILLLASLSDLRDFRIPNILVAALIGLFLVAAYFSPAGIDWRNHLTGAALLFAVGIVMFSVGFLGAGDVKLLAAVSLWVGLKLLLFYLFYLLLFGGLLALALIILRFGIGKIAKHAGRQRPLAMPRVLMPHESVPYAVAIATAVIPVWRSMPLTAPW